MKKLTLAGFISFAAAFSLHAAELQHVHPLNWWSGMQESRLQILLHGENIGACEVSLAECQGIELLKTQRVANPNYLFVYVDLKEAQPQTFQIELKHPGGKRPVLRQPYQILERDGHHPDPFGPQDVLYLLMPDRFINANAKLDSVPGLVEPAVKRYHATTNPHDGGRHGGDLQGMASALDYLQQLGITAIWPTPVQINDGHGSYHGYAITDYYQIDPRLGSNEEYKELVANCHRHGIKMVMDLVFNHCGSNSFLFKDLPQSDWFNNDSKYVQSAYRTGSVSDIYANDYDRKLTTDGWFVESMPDFNQRNPLVKDYLIQNSIWWVEYAGIDGIRQDTYPYADREMMAEWNLRLEQEFPGFNVVGETWVNNPVGVAFWQKDSKLSDTNSNLKTVMDFPLMTLLNQVCDEESNDWNAGLSRLYDYLSGDVIYANPNYLLTFLDNHDTDRFAPTAEKSDIVRYKQTLALLLTLRGIPQLYYGDEIGEYGNKSVSDGLLRQDFPVAALAREGRNEKQNLYFDYASRLLNWRKGCEAIHTGKTMHYGVYQGCYVYSRYTDNKRVTVIANGTSQHVDLNLDRYAEVLPSKHANEIITGTKIELKAQLPLEARQVMILEF